MKRKKVMVGEEYNHEDDLRHKKDRAMNDIIQYQQKGVSVHSLY